MVKMKLHAYHLGSLSSSYVQKTHCQKGAGWPQSALKHLQLSTAMPEIHLSCLNRVSDHDVVQSSRPPPCRSELGTSQKAGGREDMHTPQTAIRFICTGAAVSGHLIILLGL